VRQPFNVNNLALAGAIAALDDHPFLARSYASNRSGMEQIVSGLKRLGLAHIPSHGNFVTFEVAERLPASIPEAAAPGGDRATDRRLWHAQSPARHHRPGAENGRFLGPGEGAASLI
jgi:hypothetical protein